MSPNRKRQIWQIQCIGLSAILTMNVAFAQATDIVPSRTISKALNRDLVLDAPVDDDGYTEPEASAQIGLNTILFDLDSAKLRPDALRQLDEVVVSLKNDLGLAASRDLVLAPDGQPEERILIEGHTCDLGATDHNFDLSQRRADAVRRYLTDHGVSPRVLDTRGLGESRPLVANADEVHRQLNRRVAFILRLHSSALKAKGREIVVSSETKKPYLEVHFTAKALSEGGRIYKDKEITALRSGDKLQMGLDVRRGCYAYVFARNASEKVTRLFPPAEAEISLWANPGDTWNLPAQGNEWYSLDETTGREIVCVIASGAPAKDVQLLEALLVRAGDTVTAETLEKEAGLKRPELHMLVIDHR